MRDFIITLIICSATMSAVILAYMAIMPLLTKRYHVKWRYYAWLIIVFGLIIPFRPQFSNAIVKVDTQSEMSAPIIQIGNASPITVSFANIEPFQPATQAPVPMNISLWQIAAIVWLAGVVLLLSYHVIKHYRFSKMTKRWSEKITDEQTISLFQKLKEEMKISSQIELYRCSSIGSPMMVGFTKPRILFPECDFDQDELSFILKHELVHYKRKDLLYKSLVLIATIIHWFNPFVYLMAKAIDMQCELSCDETVVKHTNQYVRQQYSETIIGVVKFKSKMATALSTNYCGSVKDMKKRILSILDTAPKKTGAIILCVALLLIAISGSFIMITKIINNDLEKNLNLLKSGDTKPLTGFAIGEPVDYVLVEDTGEYRGGGRISKLKSGKYSDIYLFFSEVTNNLEGLGAEEIGNFFGIILGETDLQTISDILGQPDVYEEESDMYNLPMAIYYFEKNTLYLNTDSEYKVTRITYNTQINGSFVEEASADKSINPWISEYDNEKGIFYLGMSKEELFLAIEKYGLELKTDIWNSGQTSDGGYTMDFGGEQIINYYTDQGIFTTDKNNEVTTINLLAVPTQSGLRVGDDKERIEELYKSPYKKSSLPGSLLLVYKIDQAYLVMTIEEETNKILTISYTKDYLSNIFAPANWEDYTDTDKAPSNTLYVNERLAFSIEFPAEWERLYEIEEDYIERDMRGGTGITVYQKATHDRDPSLGQIFYLERWIGTYTPQAPPIWAGYCETALEVGKYTYMLRTSSDVRYIENDTDISEEYKRLYAQLEDIISRTKFIEDSYYSYYAGNPAEKDFLDSEEGKQLRTAAYGAAKAWLQADAEELRQYMVNPDEASGTMRGATKVYDDLVWLCFKFNFDSIKSENRIIVSYEFLLQGEDSYTYITIEMHKVDGVWMVSFMGEEK